MIRNLKALGLALVALFTMGALSASSASATDFFTTDTGGPAYLTGTSGDHKFEVTSNGTNFRCTTSKFLGTAVNGSSEVTVDPTYTGRTSVPDHNTEHKCTQSPGGATVTIDMNGCHYILTGNTTGGDPTANTDATVWITCPAGQVIKITRPEVGVTISVPPQTPTVGGVAYENLSNHAGGKAIEVIATATGITTSCAPTFTCTLGGQPHHDNTADYTGTLVATCFEDKATNPTTLTTPVTEGPRIGCEMS